MRVRFRLGTLLALTALLAVLFARVANNERRVRAFQSLSLARLPLAPRAQSDFVGRALLAILGDDEFGSRLCACSNDVWYVDLEGELMAATTAPLADLPELRELRFQNAHVTDESLANLRSLARLNKLYVGPWAGSFKQSDVTDAGVRHLSGLTDLEVLDLQATAVTDAGLQSLAGLTSLKELYLGQTLVTDTGMEYLKKLPSLEILVLDGTAVTDQGVGRVSTLPNLEQIGLEETKVTEDAISYLILSPCLKQVRVDARRISRETYAQMRELRPDIDLDSSPRAWPFGAGMF
jgi:Leucine-rich repeat (LRR) protein